MKFKKSILLLSGAMIMGLAALSNNAVKITKAAVNDTYDFVTNYFSGLSVGDTMLLAGGTDMMYDYAKIAMSKDLVDYQYDNNYYQSYGFESVSFGRGVLSNASNVLEITLEQGAVEHTNIFRKYTYVENGQGVTEQREVPTYAFKIGEGQYLTTIDNNGVKTLAVTDTVTEDNSWLVCHNDDMLRLDIFTYADQDTFLQCYYDANNPNSAYFGVSGNSQNARELGVFVKNTPELIANRQTVTSLGFTYIGEDYSNLTFSNVRMKFKFSLEEIYYNSFNVTEAGVEYKIGDAATYASIDCTSSLGTETLYNTVYKYGIATIKGIPEDAYNTVISARGYLLIDGVKYYFQETSYSITTLVDAYDNVTLSEEQRSALDAFEASFN